MLEARAERFKLPPPSEGAMLEKRSQLDITYPSIQHLKRDRNQVFLSNEDELYLSLYNINFKTCNAEQSYLVRFLIWDSAVGSRPPSYSLLSMQQYMTGMGCTSLASCDSAVGSSFSYVPCRALPRLSGVSVSSLLSSSFPRSRSPHSSSSLSSSFLLLVVLLTPPCCPHPHFLIVVLLVVPLIPQRCVVVVVVVTIGVVYHHQALLFTIIGRCCLLSSAIVVYYHRALPFTIIGHCRLLSLCIVVYYHRALLQVIKALTFIIAMRSTSKFPIVTSQLLLTREHLRSYDHKQTSRALLMKQR